MVIMRLKENLTMGKHTPEIVMGPCVCSHKIGFSEDYTILSGLLENGTILRPDACGIGACLTIKTIVVKMGPTKKIQHQ